MTVKEIVNHLQNNNISLLKYFFEKTDVTGYQELIRSLRECVAYSIGFKEQEND